MNRRSQISSLPTHSHYFIGAWVFVSIRFSKRLLLLDEQSDLFLRTLVIYQVTGSATRLVGSDLMARRQRTPLTVRCKLLGVNFYLEGKGWPADFILDNAKKIALLNGVGCPTEALPHIGGQPYLWQEFVLRRADGTICVAAVDRAHDTAKYQTRTLAQRYARVLEHLPSQFRLIVAVATERRHQLYRKWAAQPIARPFTHDTLQPYRVKALLPQVQISHEEKMG